MPKSKDSPKYKPIPLLPRPFYDKIVREEGDGHSTTAEKWHESAIMASYKLVGSFAEIDLYDFSDSPQKPETILSYSRFQSWHGRRSDKTIDPSWRGHLRRIIEERYKSGKPIILFFRSLQKRLMWTSWKKSARTDVVVGDSRRHYDDQRIFPGIVMPLAKAITLPFDAIKKTNTLRDDVRRFAENLYDLDKLILKNADALDSWPVVLTMDGRLSPLKATDLIVSYWGNIVYEMTQHETMFGTSGGRQFDLLEDYRPRHNFFDFRGANVHNGKGWTERVSYGWPPGPLTGILRTEPNTPRHDSLVAAANERIAHSGLISLMMRVRRTKETPAAHP